MLDSWIARFDAPVQNMWQPGGSNAFPPYAWNGHSESWPFFADMSVTFNGSAGSVWGNVEGLLSASWDNHLDAPGNAYVEFLFAGLANESRLQTAFGGNFTIGMSAGAWVLGVPVSGGGTINVAPGISGDTSFTYHTNQQVTGTAESRPVGNLGFDVVVVSVGLDLKASQNIYFTPGGIGGTVTYRHLATGTSGTKTFGAHDTGWTGINVPLNLPGYWLLSMKDITLYPNTFSLDIGAQLGLNLWVLGAGNVGFSFNVPMYHNTPFPLTFSKMDALGGDLLVLVDEPDPDPVPEPGSIALASLGLTALVVLLRRRSAG